MPDTRRYLALLPAPEAEWAALPESELEAGMANHARFHEQLASRGHRLVTAGPLEPSAQTRARVWRHAGLERDADGLGQLLEDEHPLARMVAASALAREESRGAHQRRDRPRTDPGLDLHHAVLAPAAEPRFELWM